MLRVNNDFDLEKKKEKMRRKEEKALPSLKKGGESKPCPLSLEEPLRHPCGCILSSPCHPQ